MIVVVKYSAKWCAPCKALAPAFDAMADLFPTMKFESIDIENPKSEYAPALEQVKSVSSLPTVMVFKNGTKAGVKQGAIGRRQLQDWLSNF